MANHKNIALVILAAGSSSRLGEPKQLMIFNGKTLVQHTIDAAEQTSCKPKVLILGANGIDIHQSVHTNQVTVCMNGQWEEGMSTSIQLGLEQALKLNPQIDGILFLVSDQPFVDHELIHKILDSFKSSHEIVACSYQGIVGVPALFGKHYFEELKNIEGDRGAKGLLKKYESIVKHVPFTDGWIDIDTMGDYEQLLKVEVSDGNNS